MAEGIDPNVRNLIIRGARIGLKALTRAVDSVLEDAGDVADVLADEVKARTSKARRRAKKIADELGQTAPVKNGTPDDEGED